MSLPSIQSGRPFLLYSPSYSPLPVFLVFRRLGNGDDRRDVQIRQVLEVISGVIPLVGSQIAGVEPRVKFESSIQIRPEPRAFVGVGGAHVEVQRQAVVSVAITSVP